jgi:hypothetical protein
MLLLPGQQWPQRGWRSLGRECWHAHWVRWQAAGVQQRQWRWLAFLQGLKSMAHPFHAALLQPLLWAHWRLQLQLQLLHAARRQLFLQRQPLLLPALLLLLLLPLLLLLLPLPLPPLPPAPALPLQPPAPASCTPAPPSWPPPQPRRTLHPAAGHPASPSPSPRCARSPATATCQSPPWGPPCPGWTWGPCHTSCACTCLTGTRTHP